MGLGYLHLHELLNAISSYRGSAPQHDLVFCTQITQLTHPLNSTSPLLPRIGNTNRADRPVTAEHNTGRTKSRQYHYQPRLERLKDLLCVSIEELLRKLRKAARELD